MLTFAFPEGGTEPFVYSSFQPAILIAIAVFLAIPKEEKLLRYGVAAYGAALAAAFLIDSPMGGQRDPNGARSSSARRSRSASGAGRSSPSSCSPRSSSTGSGPRSSGISRPFTPSPR